MEDWNDTLPDFELAKLEKFSLEQFMKARNKDVAKLVLTFCIIFNDIKDYIWIHSQLEKGKNVIDMDTVNPKRGQLCGMLAHCKRMLIASFLEFLKTIRKNDKAIKSKEYQLILHYLEKRLPDSKEKWQNLTRLATGKDKFHDQFYSTLATIRNSGTYHYYKMKWLFKGLKYYVEKRNDDGYVSLGAKLEETRFHFGDAVVQHYHMKIVEELYANFEKEFFSYIEDINELLRFIVEIYLRKVLGIELNAGK